MVKKPNGVAKAKGAPAGAGSSAVVPSKVNASSPGSVKTSRIIKKRIVKVNRKKATAAAAAATEDASVGAGTAGGDAIASVSTPQLAAVCEASPVAQALKPATDAEGSVPPLTPATVASASAEKPKPADTDAAAAASSKGKGVAADNSGADGKLKNRKERPKERAMNGKGKEAEEDRGRRGKGNKAVGKKVARGDNKGAGFIFMCNAQTKQECYQNRLFGLPNGKLGMVKKIRPGAKLFLYDFDLKLLYGVYKAASNGGLNLVREAFNGKFPAQIKFKIDRDCLPLRESSFKHAIKENYRSRSKFDPELSSKQVHRLIELFEPANVPQSVPDNRLEERRQYDERRQPYHFEERRSSLPIEEVRQPRFDEQRHPQSYMFLLRIPHLVPEPRHIPLALESRHAPLVLERQHVHSVPELRHVPSAYYHSVAPSDDSYYRSVADVGPERYADRTLAERTARDPVITRDHTTLSGELPARADRLEELYRSGGISRGAHVEELYHPRELAVRADRAGISTRADRLEELYRSEQRVTRAVDLPRHSTYLTSAYEADPAYAEPSQRSVSARANASGVPVSSLYSFSGGPVYR
ncbi:hypothetical protein EJB05_45577 [Eragrostis curvula]|uniref:DCD domain-containing protein n=1 Tax=Eragrostis curvula TaxID=38414 RepID=A0A5J9TL02_9POAL|nr:hypothetical protein EJB05_45577 [Eragrostis curvula]